jgi:eukaryotic-like serine/threonine-protein kinase
VKDYEILECIAETKHGKLWKAQKKGHPGFVALKILSDSPEYNTSDVPENENFSILSLKHENIARIIESGTSDDGRVFLCMEFIEGSNIQQIIRSKIYHPLSWWIDIILQAAAGLRAAYLMNIIHRDIKPANIIVREDGISKIVDFGLVRLLRRNIGAVKSDPGVVGTPRYMSPEQCKGQNVDHLSDIYSLGATFYHCLAGKAPFDAATDAEIMNKQIREDHVPLYMVNSNIPEDVSVIVDRMLEKDLSKRFSNYDHIIDALSAAKLAALSRERMGEIKEAGKDSPTVHESPGKFSAIPDKEPEESSVRSRLLPVLIILCILFAILGFTIIKYSEKEKKSKKVLKQLISLIIKYAVNKE